MMLSKSMGFYPQKLEKLQKKHEGLKYAFTYVTDLVCNRRQAQEFG